MHCRLGNSLVLNLHETFSFYFMNLIHIKCTHFYASFLQDLSCSLQIASLVSKKNPTIRSIPFLTSISFRGVVLASETMDRSLQGNNCYNMRDHGGIIVAFKNTKAEGLAEPELRACIVDLAQPGTFMQNRAWQRGRRGGWEVYGGLFGGHPDPPKPIPIFADPELNESSDTDKLSEDEDHAESLSEDEDHAEISELLESKPKYLKFNCSARLPSILVENKMVGNSNDVNNIQIVKCECDNNCNLAASKFDKRMFEGETMTIRKNKLLGHLRTQRDIFGDCEMDGFYYGGHCYCVSAFSNLTCISVYLLKQIKEAHLQGLEKFEHANSFLLKVSPNKENAICWFKSFCEIYGQRAPDEVLIILPSWLNVTTIYEMYKCENVIKSERISFSTFCLMVKSEFGPKNKDRSTPRVRFSKHSSHSVCSICSDLNSFQRTCRSQDEINLCRALKMKHKERYATQRRCISDLRQISLTFPAQQFSIYLDSMDNHKSHIPRFLENTKNVANFYKLPSKITAGIIYSSHYSMNRKIRMFVNMEQYEQGSNMIVSMLYRLILEVKQDMGRLPPKVHISLDNCYRENKNRFTLSFLTALVQHDIFSEVNVTFLLVGHTVRLKYCRFYLNV